jgi:hypothetical protein
VSIQDKMPDELGFLRKGTVPTGASAAVPGGARGPVSVRSINGWTLRQQGTNVELTRKFTGEINAGGTTYDVPEVGILCNQGKLDARIDTRMNTTGTRTTRVGLDGTSSDWDKSPSTNIFPRDPKALLQHLKADATAQVTLSFVDIGAQTVSLDTKGLSGALQYFPAACQ